MSYDIWLEQRDFLGGSFSVADFNYTSNCSRMWRQAGAHIHAWDGDAASSRVVELEEAIQEIRSNLPEYRATNPENGWGDADSMLTEFLEPLAKAMRNYPDATLRVWR